MANGDTEEGGNRKSEDSEKAGQHGDGGGSKESRRYNRLAEAIGERVRDLRVAQRQSRARLATAANLAESHLGEIERGETAPSSSTLAKLAVALHVEAASLFPALPELASLVGLEGRERKPEGEDATQPGSVFGHSAGEGVIDGDGEQQQQGQEVETLLSPAVIARMAYVEARTLQKWIASGLVTPSFYIVQEHRKRAQTEGRLKSEEPAEQPSRYAAFRLEDLPRIIAVRNRARVRQTGQARQIRHKEQPQSDEAE